MTNDEPPVKCPVCKEEILKLEDVVDHFDCIDGVKDKGPSNWFSVICTKIRVWFNR